MAVAKMRVRVLCPTQGCAHAYHVAVADLDRMLSCKHCKKKFRLPKIAHYVVLEELGRGSFGVVNRVFDPQENREAAIKVLNADAIPPDIIDEWMERAKTEARVLASIVHPNILPLYRSGTHQGKFYMITPLLPGQTLDRMIPPNGFEDPVEAVEIVITILKALHHVHASKICHRDIKPGNIMIGDGGLIYVMDFGLAVFHETDASRLTECGVVMGTLPYMPPEQAAGELDRIGPWSDQYSCGVMLYKLLTGNLPYPAKGIAVLPDIKDVRKLPIPPRQFRSDIDPVLEKLILRSLEKFPGKRFGSCQAFADELREWADQLKSSRRIPALAPGGARKHKPTEPSPEAIDLADGKAESGRITPWIVLIALVAGVLGISGYFAMRESPTTTKQEPAKNPQVPKKPLENWTE